IVPVLQLFVWKAMDRYPTPAELRAMTYLALVEGAQGIGYYSYGSVTGRPKTTVAAAQPELWKSVKTLNQENADIGPKLLSGREVDAIQIGEGMPSVKMRVVREKSATLAVVVNSAATRQEAKLIWKVKTFGHMLLRSGKQVVVQDGVAMLPLEPFGVEII